MSEQAFCPKCQRPKIPNAGPLDSCPSCGIIYAKYRPKESLATSTVVSPFSLNKDNGSWREKLFAPWLYIPERVSLEVLIGRACVGLLLLAWSIYFVRAGLNWEKIGGSFLHNVILPFHEFGHVLFLPLGETMTILGGSLFQLAMPFGLTLLFVYRQRDPFGGSVTLWWCGQSWVDLAPYIDDAPYRSLPLTSGSEDGHDWGNLLTLWDALDRAHSLALLSRRIGIFIMFVALLWGAWLLWQQKNNRSNDFVADC